jgi:hypothetical protein
VGGVTAVSAPGAGIRGEHAPREMEAHQAAQDAVQQVHADLAADLHSQEILAAHEGQPSAAVQNRTHGVAAPKPDRGD